MSLCWGKRKIMPDVLDQCMVLRTVGGYEKHSSVEGGQAVSRHVGQSREWGQDQAFRPDPETIPKKPSADPGCTDFATSLGE